MIEHTAIPPFRQELLGMLARRIHQANDVSRMFAAPNSLFHIIMGDSEPTDRDFIELSAYLDVSEEYLRNVFSGEVSSNDILPAYIGGG